MEKLTRLLPFSKTRELANRRLRVSLPSIILTDLLGNRMCFVIGGFRSFLCVSVFQCSLLVIVIKIESSEKRKF